MPPFWQTWWFWGIVVLIGAGGAYGGYVGCVDGGNTAQDHGECMRKRCQPQADRSIKPCGSEGATVSSWREPHYVGEQSQPGSASWFPGPDRSVLEPE